MLARLQSTTLAYLPLLVKGQGVRFGLSQEVRVGPGLAGPGLGRPALRERRPCIRIEKLPAGV